MLCGAAALASCNLDTIPTDKYTVETFWETEEGTEAAMTGCYNILTNRDVSNYGALLCKYWQ